MEQYYYGMRLRGFSPFCQPKEGLDHREDDTTGRYHDILVYNRRLTDDELRDYELDLLDPIPISMVADDLLRVR